MKKSCLFIVITFVSLFSLFLIRQASAQGTFSRRRVLIGFNDGSGRQAAERRRNRLRNNGGNVIHSFHFVPAVSAELTELQINNLRNQSDVAFVEDDVIMYALDAELDNSWGVDRIDAELVWPSNTGAGVDVAILDTGIDYDHPDLIGNIAGGVNYTGWGFRDGSTDRRNWNDLNGHGTFCAGIVAAMDNGSGVVGVAPGANLWSVKVLGDKGSGYTSDVVQGLEWCVDNGIDIASMSFGGSISSQTLLNACNNAYNAGVLLVAAAGNSGNDMLHYPAAYNSVISVSATDVSDIIADFSSYGPQTELAAPGVGILSTYKDGGFAIGDGTSFACPHVVGTLALVMAGPGGNAREILQNTAIDLGAPGWDQYYGFGLVYAADAAAIDLPPTVSITSPGHGDTVWGNINITADASDDDYVQQVDFYVDFTFLATSTSPYSANWNTILESEGTHIITAVATDSIGQTSSASISVFVDNYNDPPVADAGADQMVAIGQTVYFDGSGSYDPDGYITDYSWDFGDSYKDNGANVNHVYSAVGTYTVTLTVTDDDGATATDTLEVEVIEVLDETEVFYDGFESRWDFYSNWYVNYWSAWRISSARRYNGRYAVEVDGRAVDAPLQSAPIGLDGKTNATVSFWWYIESGLDNGEYLAFDVATDGGNWVEKASLYGNYDAENTWHYVEIELNGINSLELRFCGTMSSLQEDAYVDEVLVTAW